MNPILGKYLRDISDEIEKLSEEVTTLREEQVLQAVDHERRASEHWNRQTELAVTRRMAEDYDNLDKNNQQLKDMQVQLRQRLRQMLTLIRALGAELRQ
jgi:hypothetical protein